MGVQIHPLTMSNCCDKNLELNQTEIKNPSSINEMVIQ